MIYVLLVPGVLCPILMQIVQRRKNHRLRLTLKTLSSLAFVLITALSVPHCSVRRFALWVLAAHIPDLFGDVLLDLNQVVPKKYDTLCFYLGSVLFLLGHGCFIGALSPTAMLYPALSIPAAFLLAVLVLVPLQCVIRAPGYFRLLLSLYLATLCTAVAFSWVTFLTQPMNTGRLFFAIGITLFLGSDITLVYNKCREHHKMYFVDLLIALYYAGQLMIAVSVGMI